MAIHYILFDLDGTLLDTGEGMELSVSHLLREMGLPALSPEVLRTFVGPPINRSLQKTFHFDDETLKFATNRFRTLYKDLYLYYASVYPGIFELLEKLRAMGCRLGVATYKRDDYAHQILEHFDLLNRFDVVQGCDMESKLSKTDIVRITLDRLGCTDLSQAILVGDTLHDYNGAKECGIEFAAVSYGFGFTPEERAEITDIACYCETTEELYAHLCLRGIQ